MTNEEPLVAHAARAASRLLNLLALHALMMLA
jgi:hypothetical protein